mgnify:CR=1 FL=1
MSRWRASSCAESATEAILKRTLRGQVRTGRWLGRHGNDVSAKMIRHYAICLMHVNTDGYAYPTIAEDSRVTISARSGQVGRTWIGAH